MAEVPEAKAWMVKAWRDLETARRAGAGEPYFQRRATMKLVEMRALNVYDGK